jgi:hypothetical protein
MKFTLVILVMCASAYMHVASGRSLARAEKTRVRANLQQASCLLNQFLF